MKKIVFQNSLSQKMIGNLDDHGKDFVVVHCHGYGTNKDSETATALQKTLGKENISSFAFDFSNTGESECRKEDLTVSMGIDELKSAVNQLKELGFKNFALSGSSFGGSVVLNYASEDSSVKAIALKAPVSEWPSIKVSRGSNLRTEKFLEDAEQYTVYDKTSKIKCPTLILHGDKDETVPIGQSKKTCKLIKNCQLEIIKGADHKLADHTDELMEHFVRFFKENKK